MVLKVLRKSTTACPRNEWALVLPFDIGKKNFMPVWSFSKMERHQMKVRVEILHCIAPPESISLTEVTENSNVCYELYEWAPCVTGSFAIDLNGAMASSFWMSSYKTQCSQHSQDIRNASAVFLLSWINLSTACLESNMEWESAELSKCQKNIVYVFRKA